MAPTAARYPRPRLAASPKGVVSTKVSAPVTRTRIIPEVIAWADQPGRPSTAPMSRPSRAAIASNTDHTAATVNLAVTIAMREVGRASRPRWPGQSATAPLSCALSPSRPRARARYGS
nr:hypothetical protein [Microbispora sp. H10836]